VRRHALEFQEWLEAMSPPSAPRSRRRCARERRRAHYTRSEARTMPLTGDERLAALEADVLALA
jgi:hypothetical protein